MLVKSFISSSGRCRPYRDSSHEERDRLDASSIRHSFVNPPLERSRKLTELRYSRPLVVAARMPKKPPPTKYNSWEEIMLTCTVAARPARASRHRRFTHRVLNGSFVKALPWLCGLCTTNIAFAATDAPAPVARAASAPSAAPLVQDAAATHATPFRVKSFDKHRPHHGGSSGLAAPAAPHPKSAQGAP